MHAAIKIISFLVFGAAVSTSNGQVLLAGMMLVVPSYFFTERAHLHGAFAMLKRLKWLFISILVVYLFFTPGQLLLADILWGPTVEGLLQGLQRIVALVLLVAAVNLLIASTEQEEFLAAVLWCLRPLSILGLSHERMAIRITLTLEAVSRVREKFKEDSSAEDLESSASRLNAISVKASRLFESAITTAESEAMREITLPEESVPPAQQWLIPVALVVLFAFIQHINVSEFV